MTKEPRIPSAGASPETPTRFASAIPPVIIAVAGLLAYANAFGGEFVFDDTAEIVGQPLIRDLGHFLETGEAYLRYPNRVLVYFTFALNYAVGGLETTGYHAVNIAVHLCNALLVYALCLLSFRTPYLANSVLAPWRATVALVVGLIFVTHPLQTQAVTYVTQRLTSLATLFYLLAVVLYVRWRLARDAGQRGIRAGVLYAAVLASAVAAMKSKEIALTLPVMIALYEVGFFAGPWRKRLAWLGPVLATIVIIPIGIFGLHQPLGKVLSDATDMRLLSDVSRADYFATQLTVVARYLRLLLFPVGQNVDYDYPIFRSFLEPQVILSALFLVALALGGAVAWGRGVRNGTSRALDPASRLVAFGIAWFFVTLALESSIFPIIDVIFEHRAYLPSVGFFIAIVTAAGLVVQRAVPARAPRVLLVAGVVVSLVLIAATLARNSVWRTDLALWTDVVAKSPNKSRPRDNLGLALAHLRREPEAIVQFREAVRLDPGNVRAWNNLGVALGKMGSRDESLAAFLTALQVDPGHPEALYNAGRALLDQGRFAEAGAMFEAAIQRKPDYAQAYGNLAVAWNQLGRYGDTIRLLESVAGLVARQPETHFNLGVAYAVTGNRAAAEREILILADLSPDLSARLAQFVAQQPR